MSSKTKNSNYKCRNSKCDFNTSNPPFHNLQIHDTQKLPWLLLTRQATRSILQVLESAGQFLFELGRAEISVGKNHTQCYHRSKQFIPK